MVLEQMPHEFAEQLSNMVHTTDNIVVISHKNPDGDAIGSGLALYHYFVQSGKKAVFMVPDQMPQYLQWMPGFDQVIIQKTNPQAVIDQLSEAGLIIFVDFNHPSRMAEIAKLIEKHPAPKVLIDHHPNPDLKADLVYSRVSSSSTAEMVFEVIAYLNKNTKVSAEIGACLFTGIMTDTGCFSYNSSQTLTYEIVGQLLRSGIDKDAITDGVYNNFSESRLRLLGYSINQKMKVIPEYQTAYIWLTKSELEEYKHQQGDTEGLVNYPLSIKGIVFSAIFIEKDNLTKCSFRSKGNFPANLVANQHFNGGGHLNAAGGERYLLINETIDLFEKILPQYKSFLPK